MFPEFAPCNVCRGSGTLMDCSWNPDTGDEWCWDEACDTCDGKGHVLVVAPPNVERVNLWVITMPAHLDDRGQWVAILTHLVSGEKRTAIAPTETSLAALMERIT